MEQEFLNFVAEILEKEVSDLSFGSSRENGDWDSLQHIYLASEMLTQYGVDIPINEVAEINTLEDFYRYIAK